MGALSRKGGPAQTMANIQKVIAEVRSTYGVKSVGAEGFCWGGHYVAALLGVVPCVSWEPACPCCLRLWCSCMRLLEWLHACWRLQERVVLKQA